MLERVIEKKVSDYAREKGWWPLKLNVLGVRGFPDRMLLGPNGKIFFIEFKQPGEKPRSLQINIIGKLRGLGFRVYVCDNITAGQRVVESETAGLPA